MPRLQATQANYPFVVKTPLGDDKLLFYSMSATEQLGRLFEYDLQCLSNESDIQLDEILGGNVTVQSHGHDGQPRFFNGYVSRFSQAGMHGDYFVYQAILRPWFWFLTRTSDCRIFQEKTVPDIVKEVFRDHGFSDFEELLSNTYRQWNYCVQYRETDFNFISRLLEQEGIYYYFKHEDGKHTMVLSDSISAHETVSGYEEVPYYPPEETDRRERDYISSWALTREIQPGIYALNDFDFEKPKASLQVKSTIKRQHEQASFEVYDYPGEYHETGDGENYARSRIEELQAQHEMVQGSGNVSGLTTGCLFKLINYGREDQNREYLIVSTNYNLGPQEYESQNSGADAYFSCSFRAIDSQQPFRATRATPKPIVQGPQTAIVVGKSGEEIWTDEYGRVKVQFHWDRYGKSDENSSCWVRVAQIWAGKSWGGMYIPRIGQEVIIEFLEGDPDRPIITGRVYNQNNMPPYGLPADKTKSTIKSNSSKGGGGSNEFRFEDLKGSEEVYLHGQKDWTIAIENDKNQTVGNNETLSVGNNRDKTVGNDQSEGIGNNKTIQVGSNHTETIGSNKTIQVGSNHSEQIGSNMTITVGANLTETVAVNSAETIGAAKELTIGAAYAETIGASKAVNVGKDVSTNIGSNQSTSVGKDGSLTVGKNLVIDAGDSIVIKTGKAQISMKKDGTIAIQGKDITVKGSGAINVKASKDVVIKGKKILQN